MTDLVFSKIVDPEDYHKIEKDTEIDVYTNDNHTKYRCVLMSYLDLFQEINVWIYNGQYFPATFTLKEISQIKIKE